MSEHEVLERRDISTDKRVILAVVGKHGAVHHWHEQASDWSQQHFGEKYFGGLEVHHRHRPDWGSEEPCRTDCWILNGPCWHAGSSLYADEVTIPCWERCQAMGDMEPFWRRLEIEYHDRLSNERA